MDIFTTDMLPTDASRIKTMTVFEDYRPENINYSSYHYQYVQNTLQLNNGNGTFSEIGFLAGVAATDWSWGALMFDFSNNGQKDIFVSNGIYRDITDMDFRNFIQDKSNIARIVRERGEFDILDFLERLPSQKIKNSAFTNNGDKTFTYRSDSLGFYQPTFSNGAAYGDLDNDGDLDLVVNNLQSEASVFRNDSDKYREHNYLKVAFSGNEENRFGIGAHVTLFANGKKQVAQNMTSRSFQSSVPAEVHFGLGKMKQVDSLIVVWPDHRMQTVRNVKANQKITLTQSEAIQNFKPDVRQEPKPVIEEVTENVIMGDISHQENDYSDFEQDPLLPHMLSTRGPVLEEGDMNGDGLEDLFITASLEVADKLFLQKADGTFSPYISGDIIRDGTHESTAAELLDLDSDGDLDLVVGSGGNQIELNSPHYRLRAYENDGQGNFTNRTHTMPEIRVDASTIKAEDFDADGSMDLFVGARVIPKEYGADPRSYLFRNDGKGNLTDVTPKELKRAGMVTEAIWTDYDADGDNDLVVVGEWMPVMFFNNNEGTVEFDHSLGQSRGWWNTIKEADLDGDGDSDYVLGNWGLNSKFNASPDRPLSLHINDFNNRGNSEYIITTYQRGDETPYPFPTYQDLLQQMPFLEERIPDHHSYAQKTYEEIFTAEEREGAVTKQVTTLRTSILVNNGGEFELRPLPVEAQVSPVYGVIARDFNTDGTTDLLLLGNMYGLKPEVGRLAGNYGVFLLNQGDLNYEFMPYDKTGVIIKGEVRDAKQIEIGGESHIIITRNDDNLMIFK